MAPWSFDLERAAAVRQAAQRAYGAEDRRVRLCLREGGQLRIDAQPLPRSNALLHLIASAHRIRSDDPFNPHKTDWREANQQAFAEARERGADEAIFVNERGEISEGTYTNVFIERAGQLLTPPPRARRTYRVPTRRDVGLRTLRGSNADRSRSPVYRARVPEKLAARLDGINAYCVRPPSLMKCQTTETRKLPSRRPVRRVLACTATIVNVRADISADGNPDHRWKYGRGYDLSAVATHGQWVEHRSPSPVVLLASRF